MDIQALKDKLEKLVSSTIDVREVVNQVSKLAEEFNNQKSSIEKEIQNKKNELSNLIKSLNENKESHENYISASKLELDKIKDQAQMMMRSANEAISKAEQMNTQSVEREQKTTVLLKEAEDLKKFYEEKVERVKNLAVQL